MHTFAPNLLPILLPAGDAAVGKYRRGESVLFVDTTDRRWLTGNADAGVSTRS